MDVERRTDSLAAGIKATGGEGDDSTPTPEQDIQSYRARLESEGHRTVAAKHYRSVLNRVANSVGAVPIVLGEMGVEHIAEGAESLSRYRDQLEETNSALTADRTGMAAWAASHEHHEEHHRREGELEAGIDALRAENDALWAHVLRISASDGSCLAWVGHENAAYGTERFTSREDAEEIVRGILGLEAQP
jgi:hypothetical protein